MKIRGGDPAAEIRAAVDRRAARDGFALDRYQRAAADRLARLAADAAPRRGLFHAHGPHPVRGVYLWGPPGRGKTWLMDAWSAALPPGLVRRVHFHDFFRRLQDAAFAHKDEAGAIDTAMVELVGDAAVVCFDEFHVHDPGDAMLVTRLLRELAEGRRRTTLVATSNYPPEGLLPNPLFHHLFEPAIALIEQSLDVVTVAGGTDYRTLAPDTDEGGPATPTGFRAGAILAPGDDAQLAAHGLLRPAPDARVVLEVNRRPLTARSAEPDGGGSATLWIDHASLCETPTSSADYLVLAERFDTWVVDAVPAWADCSHEGRQRLASVIDIAYDRDVRLVLVGPDRPGEPLDPADAPPDHDRTASRLTQLTRSVARSAVPSGEAAR
ncbi:cell division protein ZapE [Yinghuangia seranimata]|uniref:cell division protein ZapE n=1 Tax=Yinghuangia seranimata TaxID=408067 RepID=UPI00248A9295|nr:cell division protein ZapE [Yinghuangia seranimata]MDI2125571.1 cell division protein ZapE [Yinghuangia seranimata]